MGNINILKPQRGDRWGVKREAREDRVGVRVGAPNPTGEETSPLRGTLAWGNWLKHGLKRIQRVASGQDAPSTEGGLRHTVPRHTEPNTQLVMRLYLVN